MSMIETFNKAVSDAVNKLDETYQAFIGKVDFTPNATITVSSDFNCGATCNELEFAREVTRYYTKSLHIDTAETDNLELLITNFIDLPRRNRSESDDTYRNRYKFITVEKTNYRRLTPWSIRDAILHFISDPNTIQIIENFDDYNTYFQVRIEGAGLTDSAIYVGDTNDAYVDQGFIGGSGVGAVISYLGEMIDRIKCAGVDYDILFILQSRFTKESNAYIGTVQKYVSGYARVKATIITTKTSDAVVA